MAGVKDNITTPIQIPIKPSQVATVISDTPLNSIPTELKSQKVAEQAVIEEESKQNLGLFSGPNPFIKL